MKSFFSMKTFFVILAVTLLGVGSVVAQDKADVKRYEDELKRYFEGKQVTLKIDMPATKQGVDIHPERSQPLNYSEYADRIKGAGTAIRTGESIMVTKVRVKDKHVEFQLGGGGYGTFGDEMPTSVYVPMPSKSRREERLEKDLKRETDERRRRELRRDLSDERYERLRQDQYNRAAAATLGELSKQRIEQKALQAGSRFNIRFERRVSGRELTPATIREALAEFLEFSELP